MQLADQHSGGVEARALVYNVLARAYVWVFENVAEWDVDEVFGKVAYVPNRLLQHHQLKEPHFKNRVLGREATHLRQIRKKSAHCQGILRWGFS